MHTQTESAPEYRAGPASLAAAAAGLGLYCLTLSLEVLLGASVRWALVYLGAAIAGAIVPLGLSAELLAWIGAAAPLAYSVVALARPGQGRLWALRIGARRPSREEGEVLADALRLLDSCAPRHAAAEGVRIYVLDDPLPDAAVRGRALILSRRLLESEGLAAVLGHELGHAKSLDGRLTEALSRLVLWDDPLAPAERGGEAEWELRGKRGGLLWGLSRYALRFAGGGQAERLLGPLWAAHWRAREYAADAYAGSLAHGEDLARHLSDYEQVFDQPPVGLLTRAEHPPVSLRIERINAAAAAEGPK
jgi:Zn-dependent protease with chaperone function